MGVYRLLLAVLVVITHAGVNLGGYYPGEMAVISFFILSGYVMTQLIEKYYKHPSMVTHFYLDRAARLFPQYLFYLVATLLCIHFLRLYSPFTAGLDPAKCVLNFLMFPMGFFMYWGWNAMILPQSWSLGLELTFYLVIPWMLIYLSKRHMYWVAFLSFLVFLAAYFGHINSDWFGYRLLPGTLFIFLVGWSFSKNDGGKLRVSVLIGSAILLMVLLLNPTIYQLPYNKEVVSGLLLGTLAVGAIRKLKPSRLDDLLGQLSYGVYLNHFLIIWLMQKFLGVQNFAFGDIALLMLASFLLAAGSYYFVERPVLRWRRTVRNMRLMPPPDKTLTVTMPE